MNRRQAGFDGPGSRAVLRWAQPLEFALVGICEATPSRHADAYHAWLDAGHHGEMGYLAQHVDHRLDPRVLLPGARSIVVVADPYPGDPNPSTPGQGRVARYAWGEDYHKVLRKRLHRLADAMRARWPEHEHRVTVDTAPLLEREHAARAGLGWIGKHTLVIHPRLGSTFVLGAIVTTAALQPAQSAGYPEPLTPPADHCGSCTRCIDACPTGCISPYEVDASRCVSYLTLEHRSAIPTELASRMGDWVAGCDVCQDVCPHNRDPLPAHPAFGPTRVGPTLEPVAMLGWEEPDRRAAFEGSALKRISLPMLHRNAAIAIANTWATLPRETQHAARNALIARRDTPETSDMVRNACQAALDAAGG